VICCDRNIIERVSMTIVIYPAEQGFVVGTPCNVSMQNVGTKSRKISSDPRLCILRTVKPLAVG